MSCTVYFLFGSLLFGLMAEDVAMTMGDMYDDDAVNFNKLDDDNNSTAYYFSELAAQNLSHVTVNLINNQIAAELGASQVYLAMYAFFSRADVAYRGFSKFFMAASNEEREHGLMLLNYLNERGGKVHLKSVDTPTQREWLCENSKKPSPLEALKAAHQLERKINGMLLALHENKEDPHLQDYLEAHFLNEQVESIKKLSDWITVLRRLKDSSFGIHQFDEELYHGTRT